MPYKYSNREKENARNYYEANKEKIKARSAERYKNKREEILKKSAEKYLETKEANRDKNNEDARERYNPGKARLKRLFLKAAKPDVWKVYQKKWGMNNPDSLRNRVRKRRAARLEVEVESFTIEQLKMRMAEFDNKCVYCSGPFEHVDHAIPLCRGGAHSLDNLVPSCASCNWRKGSKTHIEFTS